MTEPCGWRIGPAGADCDDLLAIEIATEESPSNEQVGCEPPLQHFSIRLFLTPFRISDN